MLGRNEYKALLTVYMAVAASIALPTFLLQLMLMPSHILLVFKISLLVLFAANVSITLSWQRMPVYHPYVMFLGAFGWFFMMPVLLDVFQLSSLSGSILLPDYTFKGSTQFRILLSLFLALVGLQAGAIIGQKGTRAFFNMPTQLAWEKVGIVLFYLGLPFLVYRHMQMGIEVVSQGVEAKVLGQIELPLTMLTVIMSYVSCFGFYLYLASFPRNRWYFLHAFIFLLALILQLLANEYYAVISTFFFLLTYAFLRNRRLRERFVFIPLTILFFGVSFYLYFSVAEEESFIERSVSCLEQQGQRLETLGFVIDSVDQIDYGFEELKASLSYAWDKEMLNFKEDSIPLAPLDVMESYPILPFTLTHMMDAEALGKAQVYKSSYLNELFLLFKELGVLFGNFVLGVILVLGFDRLLRVRFGVLVALFIMPGLAFVPLNLLGFIEVSFVYLPLIIIVPSLISIFTKKANIE